MRQTADSFCTIDSHVTNERLSYNKPFLVCDVWVRAGGRAVVLAWPMSILAVPWRAFVAAAAA